MLRHLILLTFATSAFGQQLTPSLIEFLDLTAAQITRLRQNAADFNKFHGEKTLRYEQVSRELLEETSRDVLNPLALGQRYVEQEAICRELRVAHEQNFTRNLTVLTEAQKTKLKTLDEVSANSRLLSSAQAVNLLESSGLGSFADFLLGGSGGIGIPTGVAVPQFGLDSRVALCGVPTVQATPIFFGNAKGEKR